jgi:peptidyl-prolyl cis-trans isomerase SurA
MRNFSLFFTLLILSLKVYSQPVIADKIVAVVGKNAILYSEVEEQAMQEQAQRRTPNKCTILEDMLAQKLLVAQAEVDSIEVNEAEVEIDLDQRLTYFINQIGSEEKLVAYFSKSIVEIKEDMRDAVRDQIMMQKMQAEIIKDMSITPKEVKDYYNSLPSDSIPLVDSKIELRQILIYPKTDEDAIFNSKEKLLSIRERVLNGENFATLAVLYSEDPGSAPKGGEIGWSSKAELDPAYYKAAAALKVGQISKIVESSFGYHLIQLEDKSEDRIKTRHILIKPKVSFDAKNKAKNLLDSIARLIRTDSLTFERAAIYFSQDEDSRLSGGIRINSATQTNKFEIDEFSTSEYYVIRNLKVGEISEPFETIDNKGKTVYEIIQVSSRTDPHKANVKQDFDLIKNMALQDKRSKVVDEWVLGKTKDMYIRIESPYTDCNFRLNCWKK